MSSIDDNSLGVEPRSIGMIGLIERSRVMVAEIPKLITAQGYRPQAVDTGIEIDPLCFALLRQKRFRSIYKWERS